MSWINDLTDLLFPRYCKACGARITPSEEQLCLPCLMELPRTHFEQDELNPMMYYFLEWKQVQRSTAYFFYQKEGKYAHLIHQMKYYHHPETGEFLGRCAATELLPSGFFESIDLLVPVPLSKKRLRSRGYNQCEYIARGLSAVTHLPIETRGLMRTVSNKTQTRKGKDDRWANVQGIFSVTAPEFFNGKHILLIDDVVTTGATLNSCIRTLVEGADVRISVFTLAFDR